MPRFSIHSKTQLLTCDERLQRIAHHAIKVIDFRVTEGYRGKEAQTVAFRKGNSKTPWPRSKHNKTPSLAFDFVPSPFNGDWNDKTLIPRMKAIGAQLKKSASELGIEGVSYGGDWKGWKDHPHFELVK